MLKGKYERLPVNERIDLNCSELGNISRWEWIACVIVLLHCPICAELRSKNSTATSNKKVNI